MGRYVTGDFEWKFAFGDQNSNFGRVIEEICSELEDCYCDRYVGTEGQGEQVEINIQNPKEFLKGCKTFIGKGFKKKGKREMNKWCKCKVKFRDNYWDKLMIKKLIKDLDSFKGYEWETVNCHVEY